MPRDWEAVFETWTKPSSDTECQKQENAERMIRAAIKEYAPLNGRDIKIIPQGSYRNNTNVRQESDVDICVCLIDPFFDNYDLAGYGREVSGIVDHPQYTYWQFKDDVQAALLKKFGYAGAHRGDKAFDIHENTYRVDADVVAAFAHRQYEPKQYNALLQREVTPYVEPEGTQFFADSDHYAPIVNWPEQHYSNGVLKNKLTSMRFKRVVRALKNLKYDMEANGNLEQKKSAQEAASYLCECLMYNVPSFPEGSAREMVKQSIATAFVATQANGTWHEWVEVNGLKYLFRGIRAWTRQQANDFLLNA